jgi:two-component system cell cycle sensor histidine kinase/response regulator CckA
MAETHMTIEQRQRLETIGQVTSGIAHDLNNQMMLILNHLEFAMERIPAHFAVRKDLSDVRRAAERCTEMIDSLLMFGRPAETKLEIIDLTVVLAETGRMLRRALADTIDLKFTLDPDLRPVLADATQIQQVIVNLAVNARDAMPAGGTLEIDACTFGGSLAITIRDTGCGIPEELQGRIFEPYFTTKRETGGTGLGLSMVSDILKRHNAVLSLESSAGTGATFRILLPYKTM